MTACGLRVISVGQMAERVGFEPTVATRTTTVFETVPFNRSGTSPGMSRAKRHGSGGAGAGGIIA